MTQYRKDPRLSPEHRDSILKRAKEEIRQAKEKGFARAVPIAPPSSNPSSLAKIIKTQEQADFFMKQLMEH